MKLKNPEKVTFIALDRIRIPARVRPLDPMAVELMKASVEDTGVLFDPIMVRRFKGDYELIDGRHRLAVAEALGHEEIAARIWECTRKEARFMEATANISGAHMTPLDFACSLAERKRVYEELHPETAAGVAGAVARHGLQPTIMSFAEMLALVLGVTPRHIQRILAAGSMLTAEEKEALRPVARNLPMRDLAEIGRIGEPAERAEVVRLLAAGEARNASAARKAWARQQHGAPVTAHDPVDVAHKALLAAFRRAPTKAQRRFVASESARILRYLKELDGGLAE